jgi:S-DNA-T family DNA segregation ATPase FtsK/SpoIIIE
MLYLPSGYAEPIRIHGNLITTPETERIVNYLRTYPCPTQYMITSFEEAEAQRTASGEEDELFWEAAKVVVMYQQGSTSFLQRKLRVGYTRAGSIVDQLESAGVLGPFQGSKAREVLIKDLEALDLLKSDMEG